MSSRMGDAVAITAFDQEPLDEIDVSALLADDDLHDLPVGQTSESREVVALGELPAEMFAEHLLVEPEEHGLVVGQRAVEVEDHRSVGSTRPRVDDSQERGVRRRGRRLVAHEVSRGRLTGLTGDSKGTGPGRKHLDRKPARGSFV